MADNRYYSILGVTKSATQDEIKKAYKKLALKHHPDRNQGSAESVKIFKDLGEAFEVLSDKDKRSIYDLYGEEGLKRGGGPPPHSSASSSSQPQFSFGSSGMPFGSAFSFASGGGGGPAGGGGFSGFKARDPNDIFASIFSSSFGGGPGGFGGGGINADQFHAMDMDDDFGSHPHQQQHQQQPVETPPDVERPLPLTLEELYKGCTKKMKIIRNTAKGTTEDKIVEISVKPGWKVGTKIKFPGLGHENSQGIPGTMIFVIEQKIHTKFERQDNDLIYKLTIPLKEALCGPFEGAPKTIKTLDDRILQIPKQVGVIRPGQERSIYGEGMPISKSGGKAKGDLRIRYEITFPNELSQEKKTALMSIL